MEELVFNTPKYSSDEVNLQLIFPEDVWLLIFNKLKDSNDYNCIDAVSPYFHQLLLPLRTRLLFSEVIKLCSKSMVLKEESYFSLLNCRSVCKAWKQGVDVTLHQILSETNTDTPDWKFFSFSSEILNKCQRRVIYQPNMYNKSKLDKFLEHFHNSHFLTGSNPFPSRSIDIEVCSELTIYNKLFYILQIYGHHIRHFHVRLWYANSDEEQQQVLIFRKLLTLMPNVESLRINNLSICNEDTEYLERILTTNPIPNLKKLRLFSCHIIAQPLFSQIIQNNSHIKELWIEKLDLSDHSALLSTQLPSLEELHIFSLDSLNDFSRLISAQVQWPLKKLTLSCPDHVHHVNSVLSFIAERWAETLTELSIIIPSLGSVSEMESCWNLPNLKYLKIKMWRYDCLDFILPLSKSLVSLSVYHANVDKNDDSLEKDCKIEFFSHKENLGKSNIWKFFPKLREIRYADDSARRLRGGRSYRRNHWLGYGLEGV